MIFLAIAAMSIQSPVQSQDITARLASTNVAVRTEAVAKLDRDVATDSSILQDPLIQDPVITLLESENARIAQNLDTLQRTGKSELVEGYGEYYAQVIGLANRVRTLGTLGNSPQLDRLRRALVFGTYNPDSPFVRDLAREGERIVPLVLELAGQQAGPEKWNAYGLIGEMVAMHGAGVLNAPLTPTSAVSLRAAARAGLLDPAADVRVWAIQAVMKARDREAIPMLQRLAESDPDVDRGSAKVSVRSQAAEALRRIR